MALIGVTEMFKLFPAKAAHKQRVKIRPIEHHYENEGDPPYIKYGCPICEQLAIKTRGKPLFDENGERREFVRFQIHKGMEQCPCCGINIDWDYK